MNGKGLRQSLSVCLLAGGILALLLAGVWALEARAQDQGPVCPPGFEWQRMSGVGCVQSDCYDAGGRLSYTSACICEEGMKDCSEPVDYADFDQALCGINCPGWRLTACVPQDALCPGEEAPQREEPFYEEPSMDWEAPMFGGGEFRETVEHFILGGHAYPPTPGRAAAAAVTGTVMMGLWTFVQGMGQGTGGGGSSLGKSSASSGGQSIKRPAGQQVRGQQTGKAGLEAPADVTPSERPNLREAAGGFVNDLSDVIDKWPGGGKGSEDAPILRPMDSDAGGVVFNGENVRLILIGMGKLPVNTAQSETLLVGEGGFTALAGRHPDGTEQQITLVSGLDISVSEVVSVGYEGISPGQTGTVEIDFSPKLTLIARLDFEAPTIRASEVDLFEAPTMMRKDITEDQDEEDGEVQS